MVSWIQTWGSAGESMMHKRKTPWTVALAAAAALVAACGTEPVALPQQCVDEPTPTFENPSRTEREPESKPYEQVRFTWLCLDGFLVQETYALNEAGCWILADTYRTQNLNCGEAPGSTTDATTDTTGS